MTPDLDHSFGELEPVSTIKISAERSQEYWHEGTNQSTSELDLVYLELYYNQSNNGTDTGYLREKMQITYKDNTGTTVAVDILCTFNDIIGIDIENGVVTDWNELDVIDPVLTINSRLPPEYGLGGEQLAATAFSGFEIYNGSSANLNITQAPHGGGSWTTVPAEEDKRGDLNFRNCSMRIGQVTLDTEPYSCNGTDSTKSIVKLDVHINATIGYNFDKIWDVINATLSFTINHTVDYTKYKYGLNVDWSSAKDWYCRGDLNDGDPFCLMALDSPSVCVYVPEFDPISTFETNANNDTAIFKKNDSLLSEFSTITTYTLKGNPMPLNTSRYYYELAGYDAITDTNSSSILVFFDGFIYNQSTGFECDPTFILYTGVPQSGGDGGIQGYSLYLVLGILSVVAILVYKKRVKSKISVDLIRIK